jgi:hypothetical protein
VKPQAPHVGAIVHYRPIAPPDHVMHGMALAAIVVFEWDGREQPELKDHYNLAVFDPDGGTHSSLQVPFYDGNGARPTVNHCEWPGESRPRIQLVS